MLHQINYHLMLQVSYIFELQSVQLSSRCLPMYFHMYKGYRLHHHISFLPKTASIMVLLLTSVPFHSGTASIMVLLLTSVPFHSGTELRSTLPFHDSALVDRNLDPYLLFPSSRHLGKN